MNRRALLSASVLVLSACGDDYSIRWTPLSELPEGAALNSHGVELSAGSTLGARATVIRNGHALSCEPEIVSDDPDVLFTEPAERGATVFIGVATGETTLSVRCASERFDIEGRVTPDEANMPESWQIHAGVDMLRELVAELARGGEARGIGGTPLTGSCR